MCHTTTYHETGEKGDFQHSTTTTGTKTVKTSFEKWDMKDTMELYNLERDVYYNRVLNQGYKEKMIAYHAEIKRVIDIIEQIVPRDEAMSKIPDVYHTLFVIEEVMLMCPGTFAPENSGPPVPLQFFGRRSNS